MNISTDYAPQARKKVTEMTPKDTYFLKLSVLKRYGYEGMLGKKGYASVGIRDKYFNSVQFDEKFGNFNLAKYLGDGGVAIRFVADIGQESVKEWRVGIPNAFDYHKVVPADKDATLRAISSLQKGEETSFMGEDGLEYIAVAGSKKFEWHDFYGWRAEIYQDRSRQENNISLYYNRIPQKDMRPLINALERYLESTGSKYVSLDITRHYSDQEGSIYIIRGTLYSPGGSHFLNYDSHETEGVEPLHSPNHFALVVSTSAKTDNDAKATYDYLVSMGGVNVAFSLCEQKPQKKQGLHLKEKVKALAYEKVWHVDEINKLKTENAQLADVAAFRGALVDAGLANQGKMKEKIISLESFIQSQDREIAQWAGRAKEYMLQSDAHSIVSSKNASEAARLKEALETAKDFLEDATLYKKGKAALKTIEDALNKKGQ